MPYGPGRTFPRTRLDPDRFFLPVRFRWGVALLAALHVSPEEHAALFVQFEDLLRDRHNAALAMERLVREHREYQERSFEVLSSLRPRERAYTVVYPVRVDDAAAHFAHCDARVCDFLDGLLGVLRDRALFPDSERSRPVDEAQRDPVWLAPARLLPPRSEHPVRAVSEASSSGNGGDSPTLLEGSGEDSPPCVPRS